MNRWCRVLYLGLCDYLKAYNLQKRLVKERVTGKIPDTLLLLSHPPVYTIGRSGSRKHILAPDYVLEREGIKVYEVDRGGDITYHGPGQLVGYPILNLRQHGSDLHKLLRMYEEVFIRVLAEYGVEAGRLDRYPGVWAGQDKICAVGIGVSNWVSYHGWAFNINPDMKYFSFITPCGIRDKGVTSLTRLLGRDVPEFEIMATVGGHFGDVFNLQIEAGYSAAELSEAVGI
ncbi:lipoyl(octanoyl) transferase LipB [Pelotomaculum isophthalicicum JI]|uniref:Octanoyltransferase n=1 Tax=Pelotomaculum isophthalicicum JI TaxID=947010 RepID=A0A9X4GYN1_9FIRM|nr:lipoyl(octanoyl) transferase LipB [Pelotomaculum isophthalicicum]MDF9407972.1 lipoyl(octanoyl) transferase LipB [Pelotomaculum isophthalicicum JI]